MCQAAFFKQWTQAEKQLLNKYYNYKKEYDYKIEGSKFSIWDNRQPNRAITLDIRLILDMSFCENYLGMADGIKFTYIGDTDLYAGDFILYIQPPKGFDIFFTSEQKKSIFYQGLFQYNKL